MNRFALILAWLASLATGAAFAGSVFAADPKASEPPLPTTTVHAPPTPKLIQSQAEAFVQSYAAVANPSIDQIGRWRRPVCVLVMGLPKAEQAARIKNRIETIARTLGLPGASADCRPNVQIAFEDDPQSALDSIAKNSQMQYMLGYSSLSNSDHLKKVTHPIQSWYVTGTTNEGVNLGGLIGSGLPSQYWEHSESADDPHALAPVGCFNRSTACENAGFRNVLIVADNKALQGNMLSTVADDLVMLALSQPRTLDGCLAFASVIDRFANKPCLGRPSSDRLTPADTAYLSALYSADLESRKHVEQADMASRMAATLIKTEAEAKRGSDPSGSLPVQPNHPQ